MLARRIFPAITIAIAAAAFAPAAFSQLAPPDSLEPVTEPAKYLSSVEDRDAALTLLQRARKNYRPGSGNHPFTLRATFTATGHTQFEGDGTFEETVAGPGRWKMASKIGGLTVVRLVEGGRSFGNSASDPIPMRLELIWTALFDPIAARGEGATLRMATVNYKGAEVNCVLASGSVPRMPATRYYQEVESCVDPQSGLIRVWSEKPGIYAEYDYTNSINFHGNVMAGSITISEAGAPVVAIHIDSLRDPSEEDLAGLKASPDLVPSFGLGSPLTFPISVPPLQGNGDASSRVIVHAVIDAVDGKVVEAEALQNSNPELAQAALEYVKAKRYPPTGIQREAFINVMFNLPVQHSEMR